MTKFLNESDLSTEYLKEILHYEPSTGNFTWRVKMARRLTTGDIAGCAKGGTGYRVIRVCGRLFRAHRLAWLYMTGAFPKEHIDHRDGNPSNNKWKNLREVTRSQNMANSRTPVNSRSGMKGVSWHTAARKWCARCGRHYLGLFEDQTDAMIAANFGAIKHHGKFARLDPEFILAVKQVSALRNLANNVIAHE